jgi:uncharacterized protein
MAMIELLKEIIVDFQESPLVTGIPRQMAIQPVPGKATVCIGVRRCGKSTYLFQVIQKLLASGVPCQNILFLNFFDDRLHGLQQKGIASVTEAYFALYPEKKGSEKIYCFFDEIQMVAGWEPFVDRLLRTELCEVYLTGSSARMLSKEIATQMRGRALAWEVFPFSFREFLASQNIACPVNLSAAGRLHVQKAFNAFWEAGGFPETAACDRALRTRIHQEYFHAILFRDLIERHDIAHPKAVSDLAYWLTDNIASLYSINNLTGYLKSLGHKAPKSAVSDYLGWFEDSYFLFTVRLFDASLTRSNANAKKIYCIDHALVRSVSSGILLNSGHLLENLVFTALRRISPELYYYRTRSGKEVDFIVLDGNRKKFLVQVCETLASPATRKREVAALAEAMAELNLASSTIVTRHEDEDIPVEGGNIAAIPAWRFLLQFSISS